MENKLDSKNFLPYGKQFVDEVDIEYVTKALRSDFLTNGPLVKKFEEKLSEFTGARYCTVSSSGTSALHLAVKSLGITKGDYVIVPGITFLATANAVRYEGGEVLFADIDPNTGLMPPEYLEFCISSFENRHRIKAVINVHMAGHSTNLQKIYEIARQNSLKIIDDAAHALGSKYHINGIDYSVGSCQHCDITTFSFHPLKNITTGEGGAITTNDEYIYNNLLILRNHGMSKNSNEIQNNKAFDKKGNIHPWYYEMIDLGFNYRLSDINCALGISQLKKIEFFYQQRLKIKQYYDTLLLELQHIRPIDTNSLSSPMWHLYVVLIDFKELGITREDFVNYLANQNIGTQVHYIPLYYHPYYQKFRINELHGCELYFEQCLSLPLFPQMSLSDVDRVVGAIKKILSNI